MRPGNPWEVQPWDRGSLAFCISCKTEIVHGTCGQYLGCRKCLAFNSVSVNMNGSEDLDYGRNNHIGPQGPTSADEHPTQESTEPSTTKEPKEPNDEWWKVKWWENKSSVPQSSSPGKAPSSPIGSVEASPGKASIGFSYSNLISAETKVENPPQKPTTQSCPAICTGRFETIWGHTVHIQHSHYYQPPSYYPPRPY